MMVLTMPWHLVGLLGMPRRMAYFDYTHPDAPAAGVDGDGVDDRRLRAGGLGAALRLHPGDGAQAAPREPAPFTFSAPAHPGARTPVALNGFALWVDDDDRADGRELRLPDRAARVAEGDLGAGRSASGGR